MKIEHPIKPKHKSIEGKINAHGLRFGIVVSRFNQFITERLLTSAIDCLHRSGAKDEDIFIVRVPGAFEIPSAARTLAQSGKVDAIITLGCLLRGETSNYEHIAEEVTRGVGQSAQDTEVPHTWGVLTCDNLEQAIDRAGLKSGNKGFEAAMSAIEMASLQHQLRRGKRVDDHHHQAAHGHATHEHGKNAHDDGRERRKAVRLSDLERVVVKTAEKHGKKI
ncbi:MAG: 6,7-dimethyl-8-ribityllumazine synthase [Terriglobales bacterium]